MTKKSKDPRREKELDYENYHFSPGKSDKGFRKTWRRKKARCRRLERHKVNQALDEASLEYDSSVSAESKALSIKTDKPLKWLTMSLREKVEFNKEKRKRMYRAKINRRNRNQI